MVQTQVLITTYGNQRILSALANDTTVPISAIVYGDANGYYYEPNISQTQLVHQTGSIDTVTKTFDTSDGFIYLSGTIPPNAPSTTIRELGVLDNLNKLIAVAIVPEVTKPETISGITVSLPISIGFKTGIGNVLSVVVTYDENYATKSWVHEEILSIGTLPSMTGQSTKYLTNNGTYAFWDYALNYKHVTNCILQAPNGVLTGSGTTLTIRPGVQILAPNGLNTDKSLNNTLYTVSENTSITVSNNGTFMVFLVANGGSLYCVPKDNVLRGLLADRPSALKTTDLYLYYATDANACYTTTGSTTASWSQVSGRTPVGEVTLASGSISSVKSYNTLNIVTEPLVQNAINQIQNSLPVIEYY